MNWIYIYNSITYSLTLIILMSAVLPSTLARYGTAFIIMIWSNIIFGVLGTSSLNLFVNIIILTACLANREQYWHTLCTSLIMVTVSLSSVALTASALMLFAPSWFGTAGYNLFVGAASLTIALAVTLKKELLIWLNESRQVKFIALLALILFVSISSLSLLGDLGITVENTRLLGVLIFAFGIIIAAICFMIYYIYRIERHALLAKLAQEEQFRKQTQAQFEKIMALKHYYSKLYHSATPFLVNDDIAGLREYFEKYISPIHNEYIQPLKQFSGVKNTPIHNLLVITHEQVHTMENVTLEMFADEINIPETIIMEAFEILSNFIDNAVEELLNQSRGLLRIEITQHGNISISVSNTVNKNFDMISLYRSRKRDGERGHGIRRIHELISQSPRYGYHSYISGKFESKDVLVQLITIQPNQATPSA